MSQITEAPGHPAGRTVSGRWLRARLFAVQNRIDAKFPLWLKLALPAIAIGFAGGAILGVTVYRSEAARIREDYRSRALLIAHNVQGAANVQIDAGGSHADAATGLQRQIDALVRIEPSILRVDVYELDGDALRVAASSDQRRVGTVETDAQDLRDELAAMEHGRGAAAHDEDVGGATAVDVWVPFRVASRSRSVIAVHLSAVERDRALASLLRNFIMGVGGSVTLAALVLTFSVRVLILRRASSVVQAADRLQSGDFTVRIANVPEGHSRDEMLELARRFNQTVASVQELHEQLAAAATTDQLTGLHNRRHVMETLDREIARAHRTGQALAVIMADVDGLKGVNDRLGHVAGDAVIRAAAEAVHAAVRTGDYTARIGGDEFVAVLPGCGRDDLCAIVERLQSTSSHRARAAAGAPGQPRATVSAGGAILEPGDDATSLLQRADDALYEAKRAGKDQSRIAA